MILQALNNYYERSKELPRTGWIRRGVDYIVVLDADGNCTHIESVGEIKKGKTIPHEMLVPAIGKQAMKHTNSGKDANLLWDNASFSLGSGKNGVQKLASFLDTLRYWLKECSQDAGVKAVERFCESLQTNADSLGDLLKRFQVDEEFSKRDPVLVFRLVDDIEEVHARAAVREVYEKQLTLDDTNPVIGDCLITGRRGVPITSNEIVIKNVWGSQSSGANIISFNKRSFESYGKRERNGENAPISKGASFAYTTALNHLLTSPHRMQVGDASTVFWAEETHELEDLFGEVMRDDPDRGTDAIKALYHAVNSGKFAVGKSDARFYVLGLAAPSGGRITVRFWETATAYDLATRIAYHFNDLRIVRGQEDVEYLPLSRLLKSCSRKKIDGSYDTPPNLAGEIMRAILEDLPYPVRLLNFAVQRCRSEQHVTYPRAAVLKACLNRIRRQEELKVELDEENNQPAYLLGRLFAVLERLQEEANPGIRSTIRNTYWAAASGEPLRVFPKLIGLGNRHLHKLKRDRPGRAVNLEKLIATIISRLDRESPFPTSQPAPEQARFIVGFYQQKQHPSTYKAQGEQE